MRLQSLFTATSFLAFSLSLWACGTPDPNQVTSASPTPLSAQNQPNAQNNLSNGAQSSGAQSSNTATPTTSTGNTTTNRKPVVQFLNATPSTTSRKEDIVSFSATAFDADQDSLKYTWHATKGMILNPNGPNAQWQPLKTDGTLEEGIAIISVVISDGKGGIDSSSTNMRIAAGGASKQEQTTSGRVRDLLLGQSEIELALNEEKRLDATLLMDDGTFSKDVVWVSSDESILQISANGIVKRINNGNASVVAIAAQDVNKKQFLTVFDPGQLPQTVLPVPQAPNSPLQSGPPLSVTEGVNLADQVLGRAALLGLNMNPIAGQVGKGEYQYYKLDVSSLTPGTQLTLRLEPQSGSSDVDLYMGRSPSLSKDAYQMRSTRSGVDEITLQTQVGDVAYYLAVYGFGGGGYQLRTLSSAPSALDSPSPNSGGSGGGGGSYPAFADISVINTTTFYGKVFDDLNIPLSGTTITAKSLNSSIPFEATTTTVSGNYVFSSAPVGVQIEIVASKPGFTTRRRVEVLSTNPQGLNSVNRFDFGTDGAPDSNGLAINALSDKPEVIAVTPGRNSSGVDPKTSFVLKFSEPMDRDRVEDAFSIYVFKDALLSIHTGPGFASFERLGGGGYLNSMQFYSSSIIWDESDFNASWNNDDTEVTFTFADEKLLPTDKQSNRLPEYMITFAAGGSARVIGDKSGILRNNNWFKLTEGSFENFSKFAIRTDNISPTLSSITATSKENGSLHGDAIRVRFSERMLIDTKAGDIGASNTLQLNVDQSLNPLNPNLYMITVNPSGANTLFNWGTLTSGGATAVNGQVVFDADDLTRKSVLLIPDTNGRGGSSVDHTIPSNNIFNPADVVQVNVANTIVDPAGNTMDAANTQRTTNAN
jgi:hypothetical protein